MSEDMIKGFEGENIKCSKFTEKIRNNYIDYKFEYENNQRIINKQQETIEDLQNQIAELKDKLDTKDKVIDKMAKAIDDFIWLGDTGLIDCDKGACAYCNIEKEEECDKKICLDTIKNCFTKEIENE